MITELSVEQVAKFPDYIRKWSQIGWDISPTNDDKAIEYMKMTYKRGGLEEPKKFILCDGPTEFVVLVNAYCYKKVTGKDLEDYNSSRFTIDYSGWGQYDAGWLSLYDFSDTELNIDGLDILDGLKGLSKEIGVWWGDNETVIMCRKADRLKLNDTNLLHCVDGPAIHFKDGTELYAYEGVILEKKWIMDHSSITLELIDNMDDEEKKRVLIDLYGVERYLNDNGSEVLDMDMVHVYERNFAPRALIQSKRTGLKYLVGTDGSTHRVYYMNVENTANTCKEAHESISPLNEDGCIASS